MKMTKEEAIKVLKEYRTMVMNCLEAEVPAFDLAIESLSAETEQVTSKLKNPCDSLLTDDSDGDKESKSKLDLISRQWLLDLYDIDTTNFKETAKVPLEVVIQNIKDAPTIEPIEDIKSCGVIEEEQNTLPSAEPSGDLISRADAIEAVCCDCEGEHYPICPRQKYCREVNELLALPSADRHKYNLETIADIVRQLGYLDSYIADTCDRPKGEWIIRDDMPKLDNTYSIECSECGQLMFGHYNADNPNYCPNCGADMRSEI